MNKLDTLISDLTWQVEQLEAGKEPYLPVDMERLYELDSLERTAAHRPYELSIEDMAKAVQIGSIYAQQISELPYRELEARLEKARKEHDALTLYLLHHHAPFEAIRNLAATLGADQDTIKKIHKARSVAGRVRQLEKMSTHQRKELAKTLSPSEQQAQRQAEAEEQYQALRANSLYSM
jgi:hypothetical protein